MEPLDFVAYDGGAISEGQLLKSLCQTVNELIEANKKTSDNLRSLCSVIVNTMLDEEKERAIQEFQRVKAFVEK